MGRVLGDEPRDRRAIGGGGSWATDRKAGLVKGPGHPLEQERDQLSDSGVVPGCEMARLPVEFGSYANGDVFDFLHGFTV